MAVCRHYSPSRASGLEQTPASLPSPSGTLSDQVARDPLKWAPAPTGVCRETNLIYPALRDVLGGQLCPKTGSVQGYVSSTVIRSCLWRSAMNPTASKVPVQPPNRHYQRRYLYRGHITNRNCKIFKDGFSMFFVLFYSFMRCIPTSFE